MHVIREYLAYMVPASSFLSLACRLVPSDILIESCPFVKYCRLLFRCRTVVVIPQSSSQAARLASVAPAALVAPKLPIPLRPPLVLPEALAADDPLAVAVCDIEPLLTLPLDAAAAQTKSGPYGHASTPICSAGVKHVRPVAVPLTHCEGLSMTISVEAVDMSMRKAVGGWGVFWAPVQLTP